MRILHSLHTMAAGGNATGVYNLVTALRPPEFQHVVVVEDGNDNSRLTGVAPVHVISTRKWWHAAERIACFRRLTLGQGIDLIHGRGWPGVDALIAGAFIPGVALVLSEHGFDHVQSNGLPENRPLRQRAALRFLGRRLTYVYASAPDVAHRLAAGIGWQDDSVPVMVGGVDTVSYHPSLTRRGERSHVFKIGVAANLRPVKRPDLILDMVAHLSRSQIARRFRVEVADAGPLLSSIRATVKDRGWDELVSLPGRVHDMPDWYRSLDAVVVSSDYEACSNVILEAMASAVPVVATDVGLTRTLLGEGSAGIVVRRGDGNALADAVLSLIHNPESAVRMGSVGRERAANCYSLARCHMAFAEMYRKAYETARTPPSFRVLNPLAEDK